MSARASWRRGGAAAGSGPAAGAARGARGADPALASALTTLVGRRVSAALSDGAVFEGHYARASPAAAHLVLRAATLVSPRGPTADHFLARADVRGTSAPEVTLQVRDLVYLRSAEAADESGRGTGAAAASALRGSGAPSSDGSFATDDKISSRLAPSTGPGRELKKFDHFSESRVNGGAEDPSRLHANTGSRDVTTFGEAAVKGGPLGGGNRGEKWDQFKENEIRFGVTTSFDELEYTTKINKSDPLFAQREAEAARYAAEIEHRASSNPHIREERGQAVDDGEADEEDRYSGVSRGPPPADAHAPSSVAVQSGNAESAPGPTGKLSYAAAAGATSVGVSTPVTTGLMRAAPEGLGESKSGPVPKSSSKVVRQSRSLGEPSQKTPTAGSATTTARGAPARSGVSSGPPIKTRESFGQFSRQVSPGRASPTPARNSPLRRPSLPPASSAKATAICAYSLEADTPGVDRSDIKRFGETKREKFMESVVQKRGQITEEFKNFSSDHSAARSRSTSSKRDTTAPGDGNDVDEKLDIGAPKDKLSATEKESASGEGSTKTSEGAKDVNSSASEMGTAPDAEKIVVESTESGAEKNGDVSGDGQEGKASSSAASDGGPASSSVEDANNQSKPKRLSKFKLNPNARAFSFNPSAPAFSPSSSPVSTSGPMSSVDDDSSARIPSSPGPAAPSADGMVYAQDGTGMAQGVIPLVGAPNHAMGGHMPFMPGQQYHPPGSMPVGYAVPQHMSHMGQPMMHPAMGGTPMYHPGLNRLPYPLPHPHFQPNVAPGRSFMPGSVGPGPAGAAPGYAQYVQPGMPGAYPMSQPIGQPIPAVLHAGSMHQGGGGYQGVPRNSYGGGHHHQHSTGNRSSHRRRGQNNNGMGGNGHEVGRGTMSGNNGHIGSNNSTVSSNGSHVSSGNLASGSGGNGARHVQAPAGDGSRER